MYLFDLKILFLMAFCLFAFLPITPWDGFWITSEFLPELKLIENTYLGLIY